MRIRFGQVDRTTGLKAIVGKDEQLLGERRGQRIIGRADYDCAEQSLRDLVAGRVLGVGMIPVRPRCAVLDWKLVAVRCAGRDGVKWTAVRCYRYVNSVPVDCRRYRKVVSEMHDDFVTFAYLQRRPRHAAVIGEGVAHGAGHE